MSAVAAITISVAANDCSTTYVLNSSSVATLTVYRACAFVSSVMITAKNMPINNSSNSKSKSK